MATRIRSPFGPIPRHNIIASTRPAFDPSVTSPIRFLRVERLLQQRKPCGHHNNNLGSGYQTRGRTEGRVCRATRFRPLRFFLIFEACDRSSRSGAGADVYRAGNIRVNIQSNFGHGIQVYEAKKEMEIYRTAVSLLVRPVHPRSSVHHYLRRTGSGNVNIS